MSSNANERFNAAGDRPLGAAKPVDPATRLSELLAQSLEELTRPFDAPKVDPLTRTPPEPARPDPVVPFQPMPARPRQAPVVPAPVQQIVPQAAQPVAPQPPVPQEPESPVATASRLDDKALAELEAELFAAAASRPAREPQPEPEPPPPEAVHAEPPEKPKDEQAAPATETPAEPAASAEAPAVDPFIDRVEPVAPAEVTEPAAPKAPEPTVVTAAASDADAARLVAKVRRLMAISLAVTFIAVGSVFGFIGYRVFKGEGSSVKTADKLPTATAGSEVTLSLPHGARVIQSAVAEDRLILTLDVGGRTEVRTFDLKTLQPAARLTFSTTP
jgi:hypothetical protein